MPGASPKETAADFYTNPESSQPWHDVEPLSPGHMPGADWSLLNSSKRRALEQAILQTPFSWGTVRELPFRVIFDSEDEPDVIFFMTDGNCPRERGTDAILELIDKRKRQGRSIPVINTIGLEVDDEAFAALAEIAKETRGKAVNIQGDDYATEHELVTASSTGGGARPDDFGKKP